MILLIFKAFCTFFSDISHRPLSHTYRQITFSKINQSKIIIICENMKNIGKIIIKEEQRMKILQILLLGMGNICE